MFLAGAQERDGSVASALHHHPFSLVLAFLGTLEGQNVF